MECTTAVQVQDEVLYWGDSLARPEVGAGVGHNRVKLTHCHGVYYCNILYTTRYIRAIDSWRVHARVTSSIIMATTTATTTGLTSVPCVLLFFSTFEFLICFLSLPVRFFSYCFLLFLLRFGFISVCVFETGFIFI